MKFSSDISKPIQNNPSRTPTQQPKVFSIPDETNLTSQMKQEHVQEPMEIPPDEFIQFRKQVSKQTEQSLDLSDKDRSYLEALLGFGIAEKQVELWNKNIKYTFTIQNLSDKNKEHFARDLENLKFELRSILDLASSEPEKQKAGASFIISQKRLYVAHAIKTITINEPVNKTFSKEEILQILNIENFQSLLETFGEEASEKLFDTYVGLNQELKNVLSEPAQLVENLKK